VTVDDGLIPQGGPVGLEPAPTIVGGVAAPSEIAVGVPNDLDLICRMTLSSGRRGPVSPGDLALQIAPWASTLASSDGATGIGLRARDAHEPVQPTRVMPSVGAGAASAAGAGAGAAAGASSHASTRAGGDSGQAGTVIFEPLADDEAAAEARAADSTDRIPGGLAAAGAAAAGVAGAIGGRVGSFARSAADKAAARAAERRASHVDDFDGEEIGLDDALDGAPSTRLDPPLPVFAREAPEAPSGAQSRIALAIVGVLVLLALFIGINNVAKIGQHDGPATAITITRTRTPSASQAPSATSQAPPTTTQAPPAAPVEITGGTGFDPQDGTESDQNVKKVFDGSTSDGWRSRWYATRTFNGDKDGVGLLLDLNAPTAVKEVVLELPAAQDVTVYATDSDSTKSLDGARKIGSASNASGTVTIKADGTPEPASKIIVFVTKAGQAESDRRYRAQISEVTVR
jgi:hypothetical protein